MNQPLQNNTPAPIMDLQRLNEIAELDLLSGDADTILQELTAEAAQCLELPISLVSIVLDSTQVFAATHGVSGWMAEVGGTPLEWSFCAQMVRTRKAFIVHDATTHPLVADNPLVTQDGVRCYAGFPLISSRGHVIGSLCVLGTEAHSFSTQELNILRELASKAMARIEERRGRLPALQ